MFTTRQMIMIIDNILYLRSLLFYIQSMYYCTLICAEVKI